MVEYRACAGRLEDKVALVTGSTHGIGLGIARRFAREGASLAINDEGTHDGEEVAVDLRENGVETRHIRADVSDPGQVASLVEGVIEPYGRIDILVNNVGGGRNDRLDDLTIRRLGQPVHLPVRGRESRGERVDPIHGGRTGGRSISGRTRSCRRRSR